MQLTSGVRAAVDEAIDAMGAGAPSKTLPIPDEHVRWACKVVEQFDVLDRLEGRPLKFPVRALLVSMTLSARLNEPMLATRFRDICS